MIRILIAVCVALTDLPALVLAGSPASSPSPAQGKAGETAVNRVLNLDGQTSGVQVPDSESLRSLKDAITMEAWFKASSFYPDDGNVNSIVRKNVAANEENFLLRLRIARGKPLVEMSPGCDIGVLLAPYDFEKDKWYHLAGTYDRREVAVYVNGVPIKSGDFTGRMDIDKSDLIIGKGDPEFRHGECFHGDLDEIRIWNVARSAKEIRATMNGPLTGKEPGLVAYWSFDDGTAKDLSPNRNDGKLDGKARITESPRPSVPLPPEQVAEPAAGTRQSSTEKRLEVLGALWKALSSTYPAMEYKGIYGREWIEPTERRIQQARSDQEFYEILLELMASLNDTHTRILSYPGQPRLESPPVVVNRVDGKVAVIRAAADTQLAPGDVIVLVEGKPVQDCLAAELKRVCNSTERGRVRDACGQLLRGMPGTTVTLSVQGADGNLRRVTLRRDSMPEFWQEPAISSRELGQTIGCVRIARWTGDSRRQNLVADFDRALEQFKSGKGLVIDVRGNGGGNDQLADLVNGRLTDKPVVSSIDFWRKAGTDTYERSIGWVRPRGPWTYKGRVAVLIDEASMSACEHFVSGVEAMGNVLLVGTPTNGAGGGPTAVSLPDGTRIAISRALGLRANGVVFEGHGIPPHIFSTPTLADLRAGRDAALETAKEWILSGAKVPSRDLSHAISRATLR